MRSTVWVSVAGRSIKPFTRVRQSVNICDANNRPGQSEYMTKMQGDDGALGNAELVAAYEQGIADLRSAVAGMNSEQVLARPVPDKWSTVECVGHIADTEIFFTDRIVRTIAMDRPLLMSPDENLYIERIDYQSFDLDEQLALFTARRRHAIRILRAQPRPLQWLHQAWPEPEHIPHETSIGIESKLDCGGPKVSAGRYPVCGYEPALSELHCGSGCELRRSCSTVLRCSINRSALSSAEGWKMTSASPERAPRPKSPKTIHPTKPRPFDSAGPAGEL